MRILLPILIVVTAALAAAPAMAVSPDEAPPCYAAAVQGTLLDAAATELDEDGWNSGFALKIEITKTFTRVRLPDTIDARASFHAYPRVEAFRDGVFFLSRNAAGEYGLLNVGLYERVDGRGLISRGRVDRLARDMGLKACPA
jgi:hypothetical protein